MRDTDCVSDINALDRHQQFPDTRRGSQIHADWPNWISGLNPATSIREVPGPGISTDEISTVPNQAKSEVMNLRCPATHANPARVTLFRLWLCIISNTPL